MSDKHKRQPNTILTGKRKSTSNLQKSLCKTIVFFWVCPQGKLLNFQASSKHSRQDVCFFYFRSDPGSVLLGVPKP